MLTQVFGKPRGWQATFFQGRTPFRAPQGLRAALAVFAFLVLFQTHAAATTPVEKDSDNDGLIDLDEVSVTIQVSAGPSNETVYSTLSDYTIQSGTSLRVRASGTITGDVNTELTSEPDGVDTTPSFPMVLDSAPHLSLIGSTDGSSWFFIGSDSIIEATASGELIVAVNDVRGAFQNNTGAYEVILGRGLGTGIEDPDSDDDGYKDGVDGAPLDPTEHLDTDGDGIGNNLDPDDDGDGLMDNEETGSVFTVSASGTPEEVPWVSTGFNLLAGEYLNFSATGTITDGANLESATPDGRSDISTDSLVIAKLGVSIYKLLGRIGHGEWLEMGVTSKVGFNAPITLQEDAVHIGDQTVSTWEVPKPSGTTLDLTFEIPEEPLGDALLRIEVWSTRENNLLSMNDLYFGRLCANRTNVWTECLIPVPASVLQKGENSLSIIAGLDDDSQDTTSSLDDFMVRNLLVDFLPSDYRIVDTAPHHIGDETVSDFEVTEAEGTSYGFNFTLTHLPPTGTVRLYVDDYDVTTSRPALPVEVNGTQVGTLCQRSSTLSDFWQHCTIDFDTSLLFVGSNRIEFKSVTGTGSSSNDYDDFMIRFVQLKLPFSGSSTELLLSYNEQVGGYADNTGAYTVTVGAGVLTDPLIVDSDGDRVGDGIEYKAGTDPSDPNDPKAFDANADQTLDASDAFEFSRCWMRAPEKSSFEEVLDNDRSGMVDTFDLLLLETAWFQ